MEWGRGWDQFGEVEGWGLGGEWGGRVLGFRRHRDCGFRRWSTATGMTTTRMTSGTTARMTAGRAAGMTLDVTAGRTGENVGLLSRAVLDVVLCLMVAEVLLTASPVVCTSCSGHVKRAK